MASYVSNLVHFVWATADRAPIIKDAWREGLHGYLGGVAKNKEARLISVGSMEDHLHACVSLPATVSIAQMANALKANSSRWVHENVRRTERFRWQEGYGAFTVSKSGLPALERYIQNQAEHTIVAGRFAKSSLRCWKSTGSSTTNHVYGLRRDATHFKGQVPALRASNRLAGDPCPALTERATTCRPCGPQF